MPTSTPATRAARLARAFLAVAGALGLWLAFAGAVSWHELAVGVPAALLAAHAGRVAARAGGVRPGGRAADLLQALRLPALVLTGTGEVLLVLARQLLARRPAPSLLLAVPYADVGDDAASALRRALAVALTSATPNFVVVGIDRERGLLVYHQIRRGPVPAMTVRLGARP